MSWSDENRGVDYEDVPEGVRRMIVERFAVEITCEKCEHAWFDFEVPGYNSRIDCPECGQEHCIVG